MNLAVINVGTRTVKAAVVRLTEDGAFSVDRQVIERDDDALLDAAILAAARPLCDHPIDAVAHRIVHGGAQLDRPIQIDADVEATLEALSALAPLHNPPALRGVRVLRGLLPSCPAIAVFDTAFHADRPLESRMYALPWELTRSLALYRYGFHGIAHTSLLESVAAAQQRSPSEVDAVTLQLGSGCSACAIHAGRSVETSMGFSPLEGLPMSTRSGDIDPAIIFHLARQGWTLEEIEGLLLERSGLLGLAGSGDVRDLLEAESKGDPRAQTALAIFVHRTVSVVGAYLTLLQGRGCVAFGGGIGTHSAEIRRRIAEGLTAWNVRLDGERNARGTPGRISTHDSRDMYVFSTDEESLIARAAAEVLDAR